MTARLLVMIVAAPMALGERIVEIARLLGGELVQAEVVEEEQVRLQEQSRAIVGASRSARVTTALRLSTTSRRGTPPQNLHAASRPSRNGLEILLETQPEKRVAAVPEGDEDSVPGAVPASRRRIGPLSQQAEIDLRHLAEWRLDDPDRHCRRPESELAPREAPRPPDVGRPSRRDRGYLGVGRERATPAQVRGHAGGVLLGRPESSRAVVPVGEKLWRTCWENSPDTGRRLRGTANI